MKSFVEFGLLFDFDAVDLRYKVANLNFADKRWRVNTQYDESSRNDAKL